MKTRISYGITENQAIEVERKALNNFKNDLRKKEVFQFSIDGHFLAKYVSVSEASRITELSKTCISRVCRGERKKSGGFLWKYI